jgi:putative transposase
VHKQKNRRGGVVKLRQPSLKVVARNDDLLTQIKAIKLNHPFWGYRRVWACLKYHCIIKINKKRVYRLMQANRLLVKERRILRAKRENLPSKPKSTKPNQIGETDMTKVKLPHVGWAYIVLVLDWHSKKIVGHSIGLRSKAQDWLDALYVPCNRQFPRGVREYSGVSLVSDNGCQPTSERYMKDCTSLHLKQIFTSFNNPKGNADTERMMRTMKEALI